MFRNEDLVSIFRGKHRAGVKPHADGSNMWTEIYGGRCKFIARFLVESRTGDGAGQAVRETEVHSLPWRVIQLIGRNVIAHIVNTVIGKPQFLRRRVPVKADGVPNSGCKNFKTRTVRPHTIDNAMPLIGTANIARRADRHVQHPIRSKRNELPTVVTVGWESVVDHHRLWRAF